MDVQEEEGHESRYVFRNILYACRKRTSSEFREVNVECLKEASRKREDNFYNGLSKDTSTLTAVKTDVRNTNRRSKNKRDSESR